MALTKETFTGETRYKEQLTNLEKYLHNIGQRYQNEYQEQRLAGIPSTMATLGMLVDKIVIYKTKEWDLLNKE